MNNKNEASNRRPLTSRSTAWAKFLASALVRTGLSADAVSVMSIVFTLLGAYVLVFHPSIGGLIAVAACIQLRLLCNLLDGMVAIEGGRKSALGALYNEVPDRIADSLFIVALGFAVGRPSLGWFGALAAALTAYIRVLGGSLGLAQDFRGPMAKPHRMATMTAACVLGSIELAVNQTQWLLLIAAWVIAVGSALTCCTRTYAIAQRLKSGSLASNAEQGK
jgi:phosphatidylglycerophosphate synthase